MEEMVGDNRRDVQHVPESGIKGFFRKHGPDIGLAVLIIYVVLLGIGTIAEVFEIESILGWWIFRSPGR